MPNLELYEKHIIHDEEYPMRTARNVGGSCGTMVTDHWHEHIEMHFITEGKVEFTIDRQTYTAEPGDLVVINRNELHTANCVEAPYTAYMLLFDVQDLSREIAQKEYRFISIVRKDEEIARLFGRIFREIDDRGAWYRQACRGLAIELLVHLSRHYVDGTVTLTDADKHKMALKRFNPVVQYMEKHFAEKITVAKLARMLCMSEDHFGHLFREAVGRSPLQFINDIRLRKAANLLETEECSVTEVAAAVGFSDYNHFGRLFRKRYGCTPNQVRRGLFHVFEENETAE